MTDSPTRSRGRVLVALLGAAIMAVGLFGTALNVVIRYSVIQEAGYRFIATAAIGELVGLGVALMTTVGAVLVWFAPRPWRMAAALALVPWIAVVGISWPTLSGLVSPERADGGSEFTVVVQNLWFENVEPAEGVDALLGRDADVLVIVEYTPVHAAAFEAAGVEDRYPYRWEQAVPDGPGLAIFSTSPFSEPTLLPMTLTGVHTELDIEGHEVALFAVHPVSPSDLYSLPMWQRDLRVLASAVREAGPATVVAGDLNSGNGHRRFRELLRAGDLRDAQDAGGGGFVATWPIGSRIPAVLRLDHILVGPDIGIADVHVLGPLGADHRGIEARLRVPRS